jgi:Tfp pilus assembly major pilin PilA
MVVVAIVAIVATVGHSAYQRFLIRAHITEAINVLDEYQAAAMSQYYRIGSVDAYYVLFSESDTSGFVSGAPGDPIAIKSVDLKYVDQVTVIVDQQSPYTSYISIGARLRDSGNITTGANFVYVYAALEGTITTWLCGIDISQANSVPIEYLPATCQNVF